MQGNYGHTNKIPLCKPERFLHYASFIKTTSGVRTLMILGGGGGCVCGGEGFNQRYKHVGGGREYA